MKKKILVLSSIYPGENINKAFTPVVHYFTKEWIKMGYEVKVVHNMAYYPKIFYFLLSLFSDLIASFFGTNAPEKRISNGYKYNLDGVEIIRLPIFKRFPKYRFSKKIIKNQEEKILKELKETNYIPDIIVGHWGNPQLELISLLKKKFPDCLTSLIFHLKANYLLDLYKNDTRALLNNINVLGFRSNAIKESFRQLDINLDNSFMCYSGIPKKFTQEKISKNFNAKLKNFLFVGVLIKRKYPSQIIDALDMVYKKGNFKLDYIGEGQESLRIKSKIKNKKYLKSVKLNGRLSREDVWEKMIDSDCFIMISKNETYGLVYLEAMAAGCITIAAKNEGFDGIIKHGYNGFLCEAGNFKELSNLINEINELNNEKILKISKNAIATASELTNFKAAKQYLNNLKY